MSPAAPAAKATANTASTTRVMRRSARSRLEIAPAGLWRRLDTSHHPSTTIPAAISSRKICCSSNGTTEVADDFGQEERADHVLHAHEHRIEREPRDPEGGEQHHDLAQGRDRAHRCGQVDPA